MSRIESLNPFFTDLSIVAALERFDQWARKEEAAIERECQEMDERREKYKYETTILGLATGVILTLTDQVTPRQIKAIYLQKGSKYLPEFMDNFDKLFEIEHKKLQQEIEEREFAFNDPAILEGYGAFCSMLTFMGQALNSFDFQIGKIDDQFKQNLTHQRVAEHLEKDQTGILAVQNLSWPDFYTSSDEFQQGFRKAAEIFVRVATTAYEQIIPDYDKPVDYNLSLTNL